MAIEKINYYNESISLYREIRKSSKEKPKLLLHVCCGACSCYPLVFLHDLFDVTILFSNSNIYPFDEFNRRLDALTIYVNEINKKFNKDIKIIVDFYDYENFKKDLELLKNEPEQGARCMICIEKRMRNVFKFASENGFPYVTTVMSVSRNKDANFINALGLTLEKENKNVKYFVSDFKKNNGQFIGVELSKKYNLYRQNYCGCEYSIRKEEVK